MEFCLEDQCIMSKLSDELNYGYISHNYLVYTFYRLVDFCGYRLFRPKPIIADPKYLLFINLGLIGDLILFRYVINDFLQFNYTISILIRDEYKFLFADLRNIEIMTLKNYKEKQIFKGLYKIISRLKQEKKRYDISLHFRGYLGSGILSTYISGVAKYLVGYKTSGFGFLLSHSLNWEVGVHESIHILNVLQVILPVYSTINLNCYNNYLLPEKLFLDKFDLQNKKYVLIHATSQNPAKNIPLPVLKYTINYLLTNFLDPIVFVGVIGEEYYIRECISESLLKYETRFRFVFSETFFNVYNLIARAKLFIGIDSSLAHISGSLNLPKIIFWHTLNIYSQWRPLGTNFYILNNEPYLADIDDDIIVQKIASQEIYNGMQENLIN